MSTENTGTNKDLFEVMPIPKAARILMLPTVLSSLVMILYSLADTFFVGLLNNEIENAGVSLAAPALLAFNAINNLFGIGASSMMSRSLGVKDYDTVKKSASLGFYGSLASGVLLSLLCLIFFDPILSLLGAKENTFEATKEYMMWTVVCGAAPSILNVVFAYLVRAEGYSLHASIGTMSGCLLNIVLDPVFILPWGLNMGAEGAGLATFISNSVACMYFFVLLAVKKNSTNIKLHPKYLSFKKNIIWGVCGVGIPASIQNLLNVTGMTVLNNFVAVYEASAVAAIGIAQKIYNVPIQIALGGTQGIMPLVGYSYASHNNERFRSSIKFVAKIMLPFMIIVSLLAIIFAEPLISVFMKNEEVIKYGAAFLRGFCVAAPFMVVDFLAVGVFQSIGLGKKSLIFALLRKVVLEIPAIIILNAIIRVFSVTYSALVSEVVLAVYGSILLKRIMKKQTDDAGAPPAPAKDE